MPFKFTSRFPLRTVTPLRVAIVEPRTAPALYAAAWVNDLDVSNDEEVINVLNEAGADVSAVSCEGAC